MSTPSAREKREQRCETRTQSRYDCTKSLSASRTAAGVWLTASVVLRLVARAYIVLASSVAVVVIAVCKISDTTGKNIRNEVMDKQIGS